LVNAFVEETSEEIHFRVTISRGHSWCTIASKLVWKDLIELLQLKFCLLV